MVNISRLENWGTFNRVQQDGVYGRLPVNLFVSNDNAIEQTAYSDFFVPEHVETFQPISEQRGQYLGLWGISKPDTVLLAEL